uniref:NADH-ubiquinone oxidoreductase chain 6 n=1 Tax=Phoeniculus purpureus TaxID=113189 RepID=A0A3G2LKM7_PHOPU|nr:NADH dehydrogenase subunit 6 [Phoeniculus purpureus]
MNYFVLALGAGFVLGGVAVGSSPSPYYGVVGLVLGSVAGCSWLVSVGLSFMALVLFMVYLGGMLVVFVYSVALAADPYPEAWGDWRVLGRGVGLFGVVVVGSMVGGVVGYVGVGVSTVDWGGAFFVRLDFGGVATLYSSGAGVLLVAGWGLLLALFVTLELVRGVSGGAIRAV